MPSEADCVWREGRLGLISEASESQVVSGILAKNPVNILGDAIVLPCEEHSLATASAGLPAQTEE